MDSATASARVAGHDIEHIQVRVESKASGSRSIPLDIYNLELEFVDGTGATCYAEVPGTAILGTDPDRVPIRYSRSMPTRAVVNTVIGLWGEAAIFLGLGLLLAAVVELALR